MDSGLFTLLIAEDWMPGTAFDQEQGGLELQGLDGRWKKLMVQPGAVLVNLGTLMTYYTNGAWRSTLHRRGAMLAVLSPWIESLVELKLDVFVRAGLLTRPKRQRLPVDGSRWPCLSRLITMQRQSRCRCEWGRVSG